LEGRQFRARGGQSKRARGGERQWILCHAVTHNTTKYGTTPGHTTTPESERERECVCVCVCERV